MLSRFVSLPGREHQDRNYLFYRTRSTLHLWSASLPNSQCLRALLPLDKGFLAKKKEIGLFPILLASRPRGRLWLLAK